MAPNALPTARTRTADRGLRLPAAPVPTAPAADLPPLPAAIHAPGKPRRAWEVDGLVWRIEQSAVHDNIVTVNWGRLHLRVERDGEPARLLSDRAVHIACLYAAGRARRLTPRSMRQTVDAVARFLAWLAVNRGYWPAGRPFEWSDLTPEVITAWTAHELQTPSLGTYVQALRNLYGFGCDPDEPLSDFDPRLYEAWRLQSLPTPTVGRAVQSLDPTRGPLDRDELDLLDHRVLHPTAADPRDRAVLWLLLESASRPVELPHLENRHLVADVQWTSLDPDVPPVVAWSLAKPNAKRGLGQPAWLGARPIHRGLGELLDALRERPREVLAGVRFYPRQRSVPDAPGPDGKLLWWLGRDHTLSVNQALRRFVEAEGIRSPRLPLPAPDADGHTHALLPVTAYRFRHGVANDRLAQGASTTVVQALLGHSTEQTTRESYTRNTPRNAVRMDEASRWALAPLARRMQHGHDPATPSSEAVTAAVIPGYVPHVHAGRPLRMIGFIGQCHKGAPCDRNPVTSCFSCPDYEGRVDDVGVLRELHADFLHAAEHGGVGDASPVSRLQYRHTIRGIEEWIRFLEDAMAEAALEAAEAAGNAGGGAPAPPARPTRGRAARVDA